jgi:hypothetical protein
MMRNHRTHTARLLALVVAAGAACSDATPSAPTTTRAVASFNAAPDAARGRAPYISGVQLSSIYVSITSGYTPFTVTVTNPSLKSVQNIYLKGVLQQNNGTPWPATAFLAYCPGPNGIVPPGDCTMSNGITALGSPTLVPGPATYTLMVLQQQSNGTMKVLDSKSVDVVLTKTIDLFR